MAGSIRQMLFHSGDLGLEDLDPLIELVNRKRSEILTNEQGQRVAGLAREEIIFIHHFAKR